MSDVPKKSISLPLLKATRALNELLDESYAEITVVARDRETGKVNWATSGDRPQASPFTGNKQMKREHEKAQHSAQVFLSAVNEFIARTHLPDQ